MERVQAEHPGHGRRPDRQQRQALRAGLQRCSGAARSPTSPTSRSASRPARGTRRRRRPPSSSSSRPIPNINAVITPNDDNANAVIVGSCRSNKIPPKTFPTTGQDALAVGPAEHPQGLPVRDRLQADLPRGAGRRGARAVPARRPDATGQRWSTPQPRTRPSRQGHQVRRTPPRSGSPPTTWPPPSSRTARSRSPTLCAGITSKALARRQESASRDRAGRTAARVRPRRPRRGSGRSRTQPPPPQPLLYAPRASRSAFGPVQALTSVDLDVPAGAGDRPRRRQRRRQVGARSSASRASTARRAARSCGTASRCTSGRPATPPTSASRPSTRTSRSATTSTSSRTCSSARARASPRARRGGDGDRRAARRLRAWR